MNWYRPIKLANKRNYLLQQGYTHGIADWAIKVSKKHARWLAFLAKKGIVRPGEDDDKLKSALKLFEIKKRFLPEEKRDINQYKSYAELVKTLEPYSEQVGKREETRNLQQEGAKIILEKDGWTVVKITTPEAAAKLLRGTEYCVKDPKFFEMYSPPVFYLFFLKGKMNCLVHYGSDQFKNIYDQEVSVQKKYYLIQLLSSVTGETISNNAEFAYGYAKDIMKGPFPKGEKAISTDTQLSYWYAHDVLKGRFPEGENAISQSGSYSFHYAYNILNGRFPEGEKAISGSRVSSNAYINLLNRLGIMVPEMFKEIDIQPLSYEEFEKKDYADELV